jgi:hypothetical protein
MESLQGHPASAGNTTQKCSKKTSYREGQVHGDGFWHANLVQFQIRIDITSNDSSSRKVDVFAHQVAPQMAFFAF